MHAMLLCMRISCLPYNHPVCTSSSALRNYELLSKSSNSYNTTPCCITTWRRGGEERSSKERFQPESSKPQGR